LDRISWFVGEPGPDDVEPLGQFFFAMNCIDFANLLRKLFREADEQWRSQGSIVENEFNRFSAALIVTDNKR
jgi:hypothetical protein